MNLTVNTATQMNGDNTMSNATPAALTKGDDDVNRAAPYDNPSSAIALGLHLPDPTAEDPAEALARVPDRLDAIDGLAGPLRSARGGRFGFEQSVSLGNVLGGIRSLAAHYRRVPVPQCVEGGLFDEGSLAGSGLSRGRTARALRSWRLGEYELSLVRPEHAHRYERAVSWGAEELGRFATLGELVRHYYSGDWREWVERACMWQRTGWPVWHHVVREAAFWRRACQLIADAVDDRTTFAA